MIRPATPKDIIALTELSIEALSIDKYDELVIDRERVFGSVQECVNSAKHFSWVCEIDGKIVGALGAYVEPFLFYERNQAMVVMWYCKHPGEGMKLMREFARWVKTKPLIKQVIYGEERKGDPRVGAAFRRAFNGIGRAESIPMQIVTR